MTFDVPRLPLRVGALGRDDMSVLHAKVFPPAAGLLHASGTAIVPITYLDYPCVTALWAALAAVGKIWLSVALLRQPGSPATSAR